MIAIGARSSPLSRIQVEEVLAELRLHHPHISFQPTWVETIGDRDQKTSLRTLGKTDFFTREVDQLVLQGKVRLGIHSAKDLPDPLPAGLALICLTKGLDPRDSLVFRTLPPSPLIATSSERREGAVRQICPDARFIDLRGTIQTRLKHLENGTADGVVVAEAALIRLKLTHLPRIFLPGKTTAFQGQLAVVSLETDREMGELLRCISFDNGV